MRQKLTFMSAFHTTEMRLTAVIRGGYVSLIATLMHLNHHKAQVGQEKFQAHPE